MDGSRGGGSGAEGSRRGHYHPGNIVAHRAFKFNKGSTVYLLDTPDGKVLVMQSWTNHVNKGETAENLKDLGSQFKRCRRAGSSG